MKITNRQKYWLGIIKKQNGVYKFYNQNGIAQFRIINTEKQPSNGLMERLFDHGLLIPAGDGMYGDSQTYKVSEVNYGYSK